MHTFRHIQLVCRGFPSALGVLLLASAHAAIAAEDRPSDAEGYLDTIVVVGERRGLSITLFDDLDLEKDRGSSGVEEVLRRAPNINFLGTQNGFVNIRGENAEGAGNSALGIIPGRLSPTPFTVDRRPLAYGEITFGTSSVYDVETIEIVRGPQTTSGGVNGSIGALNVVTSDPTSDFEAEFLAEGGSFDQYQAAGLVSGELLPDVLTARLVLDYNGRDTYLDYTNPVFQVDEQFEFEQLTARAKAVWTPPSVEKLRVEVSYSYTESSGPQTENITDGPNTDFERSSSNVAAFLNDAHIGIIETDYALSDRTSLNNHLTISSSDLRRRSGNGTFRLDQTTRDYQNELSFDLEALDGKLQLAPGIILRRQDISMDWDYFGPTLLDDERDSLGLYGQGTYSLSPSLRATFGLRYQYEAQNRSGILAANTLETLSNPTAVNYDGNFSELLPRLAVEADVSERILVGAFVARGFTPGGFSFARPTVSNGRSDGVTPFGLPEFDEETRWTFEAYLRSSFFSDQLEVLANVFYNDISDVQLRETVEIAPLIFASVVRNGQEATSYGLELTATARPNPWLELSGSLGVLETEITEFGDAPAIEGNELERAPGLTASLSIDVEPINDLAMGLSVSYVDGYFSAFDNDPLAETNNRTLVDVRVSYQLTQGLEVYAAGNNIFDERELTELFGTTGTFGSTIKPQEFVVGAELRF